MTWEARCWRASKVSVGLTLSLTEKELWEDFERRRDNDLAFKDPSGCCLENKL